MKKLFSLLWLLAAYLTLSAAQQEELYDRLEDVLSHRSVYTARKEARIDSLKHLLRTDTATAGGKLAVYQNIYHEYYVYKYDSALVYVNRAEQLARQENDSLHLNLFSIYRAYLLATTGHFSEAASMLNLIDRASLRSSRELRIEYYRTYQWTYNVWAEYADDDVYAPRYHQRMMLYSDSLLAVLPPGSHEYLYQQAEAARYAGRWTEAETFYQQALSKLPMHTRLYAAAAYALSLTEAKVGKEAAAERYLILAAISDQICPLKENLALQELALYLYKNGRGSAEQANRYLNYSLEDALFYNNRLRLLEVARKFPDIVTTYQKQNAMQSHRLLLALSGISILAVGLILSLLFIYRQMRQLRDNRRHLTDTNAALQVLNRQLVHTNRIREDYVSLFLDLCAAYIEKLRKYQDMVKRKVKAKQADDLLKAAFSAKLTEGDAKEFFVNFDTAFLSIYPHFIQEFNALLREGEAIWPKKGEILNTELRIFALIRLGVKDSSKIATLLFYSPQTIYNYRSTIRNKARERDNFEQQVEELCPII